MPNNTFNSLYCSSQYFYGSKCMHDSTTHYRYLLPLAWGVLSTCQCQRGCVIQTENVTRQNSLPFIFQNRDSLFFFSLLHSQKKNLTAIVNVDQILNKYHIYYRTSYTDHSLCNFLPHPLSLPRKSPTNQQSKQSSRHKKFVYIFSGLSCFVHVIEKQRALIG